MASVAQRTTSARNSEPALLDGCISARTISKACSPNSIALALRSRMRSEEHATPVEGEPTVAAGNVSANIPTTALGTSTASSDIAWLGSPRAGVEIGCGAAANGQADAASVVGPSAPRSCFTEAFGVAAPLQGCRAAPAGLNIEPPPARVLRFAPADLPGVFGAGAATAAGMESAARGRTIGSVGSSIGEATDSGDADRPRISRRFRVGISRRLAFLFIAIVTEASQC